MGSLKLKIHEGKRPTDSWVQGFGGKGVEDKSSMVKTFGSVVLTELTLSRS